MTPDHANNVRYEPRGVVSGTESSSGIEPTKVGEIQTTSAGPEVSQGARTPTRRESEILRVVIVDDDASTRRFLKGVLQQCQQLDVVGEAGDGVVAITMVSDLQPDLVVLDLAMPRLDGFGTIEGLRLVAPNIMIIVLSGLGSEAADAVAREGVTAFLPKGIPPMELLDRFEAILGRKLTVDVVEFCGGGNPPESPFGSRTRCSRCNSHPRSRM